MSTDLFGAPLVKRGSYFVYHDESVPSKRWFIIGLLFVPVSSRDQVTSALYWHRKQENYFGEIHFSQLPKSFDGEYGGKARVARRWLRTFENGLKENVFFSALAVDRHSPRFDRKRFSKDFHAYNRFTAMALKSGIAWHLGPFEHDVVEITFVTDAKNRLSRPDDGMIDNFEDYIVYRAELDGYISSILGKRYPIVQMNPIVSADSQSDDLLQLTDLLLGACQEALVVQSNRQAKRELGLMITRWCQDLTKKPREQEFKLHRKFSFQVFPDTKRGFAPPPLLLRNDRQLTLF